MRVSSPIKARPANHSRRSPPSAIGKKNRQSPPPKERPIPGYKSADLSSSSRSNSRDLNCGKSIIAAVSPYFQDLQTADNEHDHDCMAFGNMGIKDLHGTSCDGHSADKFMHDPTVLLTGLVDVNIMEAGDLALGRVISSGPIKDVEVSSQPLELNVNYGFGPSNFVDTGQPSLPRPEFQFSSGVKPKLRAWKRLARSNIIDDHIVVISGQK
ncbi:hypothetical protein ACOSQ4_020956 [Xanthoceras sorbifolium]